MLVSCRRHPYAIELRMVLANQLGAAAAQPMQAIFHALAWLALAGVALFLVDAGLRPAFGAWHRVAAVHPGWLLAALMLLVAVVAGSTAHSVAHRQATGPWAALPVDPRAAAGMRNVLALAIALTTLLLLFVVSARAATLVGSDAFVPNAPWWVAMILMLPAAAFVGAHARARPSRKLRRRAIGRQRARRDDSGTSSTAAWSVRASRGPLPHVPAWQQASARLAWSAGAGAWPWLVLLGVAIPGGAKLGGAIAAAASGVLLIRWLRVLEGALSVLPKLSVLAAALPMPSPMAAAATWRYPALATGTTAFLVLVLLGRAGLASWLLVLIAAAMAGYAALAFVVAWHYRTTPSRRRIAMAVAMVLVVLMGATAPPLAPVVWVVMVGWHAARARRVA